MCSSTWATPRGAVDLVHRADAHPQHLHGGRRAPVGLDDQRHAVGERELLGAGRRLARGGGRRDLREAGRPRRQQHRGQHRTRRSAAWQGVFHRMRRDSKKPPMFSFFKKKPPPRPRAQPPRRAAPRQRPPSRRRRQSVFAVSWFGGKPPAAGTPDRQRAWSQPIADSASPRRRVAARAPAAGSTSSSPACARPAPASRRSSSTRRSTTRSTRSSKTALLMADTGVKATEHLLDDLRAPRARAAWRHATPVQVKILLADALTRPAAAAGEAAGDRRAHADRDHGRRRQRRRQDHLDRQAHQAPGQRRRLGAAGRGRHLPGRGARAAAGLGRPQHGRDRQPGRRRSGGRELRRGQRRQGARQGRGAGRHGRPAADAAAPDGRAEEDQARRQPRPTPRRRTRCCW